MKSLIATKVVFAVSVYHCVSMPRCAVLIRMRSSVTKHTSVMYGLVSIASGQWSAQPRAGTLIPPVNVLVRLMSAQ